MEQSERKQFEVLSDRYGPDVAEGFMNYGKKGKYDFATNLELALYGPTEAQQNAINLYNGLAEKCSPMLAHLLTEMENEFRLHKATMLPLSDKPEEIVYNFLKDVTVARYKDFI